MQRKKTTVQRKKTQGCRGRRHNGAEEEDTTVQRKKTQQCRGRRHNGAEEEDKGAEEEGRNGLAEGALAHLPLGHLGPFICEEILLRAKCKILCAHVQESSACRLEGFAAGPHWGTSNPPVHVAPLAALSGNECL